MTGFSEKGWMKIPFDAGVLGWAETARGAGEAAMRDRALAHWWVCENTWFVGVDALPNDGRGALPGGAPLGGAPQSAIEALYGALPRLHNGQLSVVRPGYPKPREGESAAAFRYREKRDAAHVDGIKAVGPDRRRFIDERHAWILGLPLTENTPDEAPLVVWEGSHEIMRAALRTALAPHPEAEWDRVDVTEVYQSARRRIFDTCRRVPVCARPGEAYLLHRLCLHGVAPWHAESAAENTLRMVAYFRPNVAVSVAEWLKAP